VFGASSSLIYDTVNNELKTPRVVLSSNVKFLENPVNGTNYVGFQAPFSVAANVLWGLPSADATIAGYALTSDAVGQLSWASRYPLWATGNVYATNDVVIALYQAEYKLMIAQSAFSSSGTPFPGGQTVALEPLYTGDWREISPCRGTTSGAFALGNRFSFGNVISPPNLGGVDQNNFNPTGLATCNVMRLTSSANLNITGLLAPSPAVAQFIMVTNLNPATITLRTASGLSTAANQFLFTANLALAQNQNVTLVYDVTTARWRNF
jgi:hypothetical protein